MKTGKDFRGRGSPEEHQASDGRLQAPGAMGRESEQFREAVRGLSAKLKQALYEITVPERKK
jgi:hypothetical protein